MLDPVKGGGKCSHTLREGAHTAATKTMCSPSQVVSVVYEGTSIVQWKAQTPGLRRLNHAQRDCSLEAYGLALRSCWPLSQNSHRRRRRRPTREQQRRESNQIRLGRRSTSSMFLSLQSIIVQLSHVRTAISGNSFPLTNYTIDM